MREAECPLHPHIVEILRNESIVEYFQVTLLWCKMRLNNIIRMLGLLHIYIDGSRAVGRVSLSYSTKLSK